jgi:putative tryptophan/tyrosine transport system substrate-binding protein
MASHIGRRKFLATLLGGAAVAWPLAARAQQPAMPVVGFLNSTSPEPYAPMVAAFRQGLKETGYVEGQNVHASTERDFDAVFANLIQLRAGGLVIGPDAFFAARSEQLATLTVRHAVPAVFENRGFVAAGGLVGYTGSIADAYRLAGVYAARILKGEKPGELPVQRSTKVEMFLNLKTAKALGLSVPLPLLGRADEVIE